MKFHFISHPLVVYSYSSSKFWEDFDLSFLSHNCLYFKATQIFTDQYNVVQVLAVKVSGGASLKNRVFHFFLSLPRNIGKKLSTFVVTYFFLKEFLNDFESLYYES